MNIIEAVKSGKRFKRKQDHKYWEPMSNFYTLYLDAIAILADDWEIDEDKVEITRSQLNAAYTKSFFEDTLSPFDRLAKELGFK